jgi:hypothetical protein
LSTKTGIGYDEVEVDVEVHQPAKPLHEGDGAGARRGEAALARDAALPGGDGADDERTGPARPGGITREHEPQWLGHGEHPLAVRRQRQDSIDEVHGGVGHAPRRATRAQAASLATERDDDLVVAGLAADAREAVGEDAAAEVGGELALDVAREAAAVWIRVAQLGEEGLRVARDQLVQHRPLRSGARRW